MYFGRKYFNATGDLMRITNETGAVTGSFEYDAFGNVVSETMPTEGTRFGKCAPSWIRLTDDPDNNLYLTPTRVYHSGVGRFLQRDPAAGFAGGYTYANNAPTNYVDVNGREPKEATGETKHTVKWGDTLMYLCFVKYRHRNLLPIDILKANGLESWEIVSVGMTIKIPKKSSTMRLQPAQPQAWWYTPVTRPPIMMQRAQTEQQILWDKIRGLAFIGVLSEEGLCEWTAEDEYWFNFYGGEYVAKGYKIPSFPSDASYPAQCAYAASYQLVSGIQSGIRDALRRQQLEREAAIETPTEAAFNELGRRTVGMGKTAGYMAKEFGGMTLDFFNHLIGAGVSAFIPGDDCWIPYFGYASDTAKAIAEGRVNMKEYYIDYSVNMATLGTYSAYIKPTYQYNKGLISREQWADQVSGAGLFTLGTIGAMKGAKAYSNYRASARTYQYMMERADQRFYDVIRMPEEPPLARYYQYRALRIQKPNMPATEAFNLMKEFDRGMIAPDKYLHHFSDLEGGSGIVASEFLKATKLGYGGAGVYTGTTPTPGFITKHVPVIGWGMGKSPVRIPIIVRPDLQPLTRKPILPILRTRVIGKGENIYLGPK